MGVISNLMFAVGFKVTNKDLTKAEKDVGKLKGNVEGLGTSIDKAKKSSTGLASAFAGISSHGNVFAGLRTSAIGLVAALGGTAAAVAFFSKSIGGAMQIEQTQMQIEALAGSAEKGKAIFDMVNDMGLKSTFSEEDFLNAGKSFMSITKNKGNLEYMLGIAERLAAANPTEGMQGAAFSMKELASGDIASIAERFNISKSDLRKAGFDSTAEAKVNIAALDKVLTQYGFTSEYIEKVNQSGAAQWDMFKSNISAAIAKSGTAAMNLLKGPLEGFNKWLGEGGVTRISEGLSKGLAGIVTFAVSAGKAVGNFISSNKPAFEQFGIIARSIFDGVIVFAKDMWFTIEPLATLIGGTLVSSFQALWPDIKAVGGTIVDIGGAIVKWEGFAPLIYGIAAAFGAYKVALLAAQIHTKGLALATKIYTGFQTALNVVLMLNPIGLVIAAIVGLGIALVLAYKKSETFRNIVNGVWASVKTAFAATMNFFKITVPSVFNGIVQFLKSWGLVILGAILGPVSLAVALVNKYWVQIKTFTISVFTNIWNRLNNTWNDIINTVVNAGTTIWTKVQSMWGKINGFLTGISLFDIGKNIIQGMIDGVGSMANALMEKIKSIGDGITDKIKEILGIHSPSRVMMDVGFYTGEGLAQGIEETQTRVSQASADLADDVTTPYNTSTANLPPATASATPSPTGSTMRVEIALSLHVTGDADTKQVGASVAGQLKPTLQEIIESAARRLGVSLVVDEV